MTINTKKYVIATKEFPLLFENNDCEDIDDLTDAAFYYTKESAQDELSRFDEPESHQVIEVDITYKI